MLVRFVIHERSRRWEEINFNADAEFYSRSGQQVGRRSSLISIRAALG